MARPCHLEEAHQLFPACSFLCLSSSSAWHKQVCSPKVKQIRKLIWLETRLAGRKINQSKFVHFRPSQFSSLVHCVANEPAVLCQHKRQRATGWEQQTWPRGEGQLLQQQLPWPVLVLAGLQPQPTACPTNRCASTAEGRREGFGVRATDIFEWLHSQE